MFLYLHICNVPTAVTLSIIAPKNIKKSEYPSKYMIDSKCENAGQLKSSILSYIVLNHSFAILILHRPILHNAGVRQIVQLDSMLK